MSPLDRMLPQLKTLRLSGILDSVELRNQQAIDQKMSHLEFLALVLGDEHERRENKKLQQRMRRANYQGRRTLENYNFDAAGLEINKAQVYDLATCLFVEEKVNVIIVGPTGVGKTHLTEAIGQKACRRGFDVMTTSFNKLFNQLRASRADGTYERKMQSLLRPDLLILDDFGLKPLSSPTDEDFHELVSERHERGSIMLTTNLDFEEWGAAFPNQVLGAAAVDRLRDQAHRVIIKGESYRRPKAIPEDTARKNR